MEPCGSTAPILASLTVDDLPSELLTLVLSPMHLSLASIGTARTVCRRWSAVGGATLDQQRRRMAAAATRSDGSCAHQWSTIETLTRALVDDAVPALLRVLDTGAIGPDDPIDTRGWNMLGAGAESTDLVHMFENDTNEFSFESFVLYKDDFAATVPPLVVTPLVMAFAYGALNCARTLIALGARPMPHVDALVSFVIERCAWRRQHVATVGPDVSTWMRPNVAVESYRHVCVTSALSLILDSFGAPRPCRSPLGIVPPLRALAYGVRCACERIAEALSVPDAANGTTEQEVSTESIKIARLLLNAGYDPHAPSRCCGPYNASRMYVDKAVASRQPGGDRRSILEMMAAETPCDTLERLIDEALSRGHARPVVLDDLLDVYRTHTRDAS
ncbi:F-box incomplete domain containing protein [Pandoravirus neocaledonia]|uniref:F-box incomplete domain containing protein n=1 Tax=Pandoravirus neocaledonia TaxID=2107708 RepID=A0A2U7UCY7_9VIRU|nr:F-box incomplete domain containing protein [Pandoravirus neocaledonia]AVK76262.1 F-box incomplete domain containing protein [Pandoravirus neocaledonia]